MKQQAAHKAAVSTAAGVEPVHINSDGTYTATPDFLNHGQVQFDVDYPGDNNFCEIKLQVKFKKKVTLDGGTVKIEK